MTRTWRSYGRGGSDSVLGNRAEGASKIEDEFSTDVFGGVRFRVRKQLARAGEPQLGKLLRLQTHRPPQRTGIAHHVSDLENYWRRIGGIPELCVVVL